MIASTAIAPLSSSLRALVQRIREEVALQEFFDENDPEVLGSLMQLLERADAVFADLDVAEQKIQTDPNLSDMGRTKQMVEVVAGDYAKLKFIGTAAKDRQAAADEIRRALDATPKGSNEPVVDYLQCSEIRSELRKLSQADRMRVFVESIQAGNPGVLRAIQTDPMVGGEPLIPADYLKRVLEESNQLHKPMEWRRWQTLIFAAERLQILANAIAFTMDGFGQTPVFPTPPTRVTDLKLENPLRDSKKSLADAPPAQQPKFQ